MTSELTDTEVPLPRLSRVGSVALLVAAAYSGALLVAGFLVPIYSTVSVSSTGEVSHGFATLVAENGLGVIFVLGIPLLVTLIVGAALRQRTWRGAVPTAWAFTGLLALFDLLALMSIGVFILPVTVALVIACATCQSTSASRDSL